MNEIPDGVLNHSQSPTGPEHLDPPGDSPVVLAHIIAEALREISRKGHDCRFAILGVEYFGNAEPMRPVHPRIDRNPVTTRVLMKCRICNLPGVAELEGRWEAEQIMGHEPPEPG